MSQPKVIDKKGMNAIFSGVSTPKSGVGSQDYGVPTNESELGTRESGDISRESEMLTPESGINVNILGQAIKQGTQNPRISSWNPLVMAVLRYRNLTTPAYSMSKEISELLEIAVKERYPELTEQVETALAKK
jgi:hypothetical protein